MSTIRRTLVAVLIVGAVALPATADTRFSHGSTSGYASVSVGGPSVRVDVGFFYNELSPYGRWFRHDDYGWVWTPRIVHAGWRPYSYGRWVDSDYGWTWASDEPFGWATYHYGRWAWDPDYGWIWLPGSVWGPAWVSWQEGDGYIGWAPLPPSVGFSADFGLRLGGLDLAVALAPSTYVFVPERAFLEPSLTRYAVAASYNTSLCRRTRNVTRYGFANDRVINTGLPVDRIERATHRRVQRWRVEEVRSRRSAGLRDGELRVFRPAREQLRTVRVAQRNDAGVVRNPRRERTPLTAPIERNGRGERRQVADTPRVQSREQQRREAQLQETRLRQQRRETQQQSLRGQQQRREAQQQAARVQQQRREAQRESIRTQQQRREAQQQSVRAQRERREAQQQTLRAQQQRREAQRQSVRSRQEGREAQQQAARAQQQRREAQRETQRAQQQRREAQQQSLRAQQERRDARQQAARAQQQQRAQQREAARGQQRREAQRGQERQNAPQRNPRPRHRPSGSGGGPGGL